MSKYVYVEGQDTDIARMFKEEGWSIAPSIFEADLLCLEGGADVCPELYGEENTDSDCSPVKDYHSFGLIAVAEQLRLPIVGICRGAQILNVYKGGSMNQHIEGHCNTHNISFRGEKYEVVCGHHQGIKLNPCVEYDCEIGLHADGTVEIYLSKLHDCMGFQPHPEWAPIGHESRALFFQLVEELTDWSPVDE